jgi:hypothetical protein
MFAKLSMGTLVVTALIAWAGCTKPEPAAPKDAKQPETTQTVITGDGTTGPAKLSEEDRKLAEKQKVCPVTGERLGSMGEPIKVTVKGRAVFLCCKGCIDEIKTNPDKYLAKLDEQAKP